MLWQSECVFVCVCVHKEQSGSSSFHTYSLNICWVSGPARVLSEQEGGGRLRGCCSR